MEKNISSRKIRGAKTKNAIYESAFQLFGEHGFDNVSVDSITKKSGISKGTFYVHFTSKNSLLAELIGDYVRNTDLDYKSFVESFPATAVASDIFISLVKIIADNITCTIGYRTIKNIYMLLLDRTINSSMLLGYNRELYGIFSSIIDRGFRQGEFKTDIPADILAEHFVMALRGLTYEWCIRYPDFDLKEQVLKHFEIILSGLTKQ